MNRFRVLVNVIVDYRHLVSSGQHHVLPDFGFFLSPTSFDSSDILLSQLLKNDVVVLRRTHLVLIFILVTGLALEVTLSVTAS